MKIYGNIGARMQACYNFTFFFILLHIERLSHFYLTKLPSARVG